MTATEYYHVLLKIENGRVKIVNPPDIVDRLGSNDCIRIGDAFLGIVVDHHVNRSSYLYLYDEKGIHVGLLDGFFGGISKNSDNSVTLWPFHNKGNISKIQTVKWPMTLKDGIWTGLPTNMKSWLFPECT